MRRILTYLSAILLLCNCTAEKRLAHLLAMHPELQRIDTAYRDRYIHFPAEQNTTTVTLDQLKKLDREATQQGQTETGIDTPPAITTRTSRSRATIRAQGNGILTLQTEAPPDTIHVHDTIYQPTFITGYKDRIVYKPNAFQSFLCYIGAVALLFLLVRAITGAIRRQLPL